MATSIPRLPPAPSSADPANFDIRADALLTALDPFGVAVSTAGVEVEANALRAETSAASAQAAGAGGISSSTTSNAVTTGRLTWNVQTGKAYGPGVPVTIASNSDPANVFMRGTVFSYNSGTGALVVDVGFSSGSGTFSSWTINASIAGTAGPVSETYQARTGNTQLSAADSGKWIDITSGTFTQTFAAPAALGLAWRCRIRNSGTGDITIPSSDGLTNWIMYPGEVRDFNSDGTTLRSVILKSFYKVFSLSANFVWPPGYAQVMADLQAAGGGGGKSVATSTSAANGYGGGSGGGRAVVNAPSPGAGTVQLVTVGTGGQGATNVGSTGSAGGNSSFSDFVAYGGQGGANASDSRVRGGAAIAVDNSATLPTIGSGYVPGNGAVSGVGASAEWAGGNSGGGTTGTIAIGGSSLFGGAAGGSGGAKDSSGNGYAGGNGGGPFSKTAGTGAAGGATAGGNAGNGSAGANGTAKRMGGGGGGAGGPGTSNGGNGGNGGIGAGGGAGGTGSTPGNGGNGGAGEVILGGIL